MCRLSVKCKNCPETSLNKQESKRMGHYITRYRTDKKKIKLKNYDCEVKIDSVWGEYMYRVNTDFCLFSRVIKDTSLYAVSIEFTSINDTFLFDFLPIIAGVIDERQGGITNNKKELTWLENMPDTIKLIVEEKNPNEGIGWRDPIQTDTVILIREND